MKIEVARRELNRMRTMVLLPALEELEELKLHVVASEDDLIVLAALGAGWP